MSEPQDIIARINEFIDECQWAPCDNGEEVASLVTACRDEIARLRSLRAASPQWISVNERLPAKGTQVLVFTEVWCDETYHVASVDEYGEWFPSAGDGYGFPAVTHWMALPAPPEVTP